MSIQISITDWQSEQTRLSRIRFEVFVQEQGVPEDIELDEWDQAAIHALALRDGQAVGTARLQHNGKIGRMAVLRNFRAQGLGTRLLEALLVTADEQGIAPLYLNAQLSAVAFYRKFGFKPQGGIFYEADIAHQRMYL